MKIEYELINKSEINDEQRNSFAELLKKQGKVTGNLLLKADRCKLICFAKIDGQIVAIGGVKKKTDFDFSQAGANIPELSDQFEWEIGYMFTEENFCGKGIASYIAKMLITECKDENLMASTEITANPGMVKILEKHDFRLYGKPWKSAIHGNYIGLFLKFR